MNCFQRLANCALFIVLIAAVLAAVAYFCLLPRLDEELADALRREFMLPPSSTVEITRGSLLDLLEGEVEGCRVESDEAKIEGLVVGDLRFLAEGLRFDLPRTLITGQAEFTAVKHGELSFKVAASEIEERWATELGRMGLSKVQVGFADDRVSIDAVLDLKLTEVSVGATGELFVDGTDRIRFRATELELGGATFGVEKLKAIFTALTPVIDLGQFKLVIAIDEVEMRDDYLRVKARSLSLAEKLAAEQAYREQQAAAAEEDEQAGEEEQEGGGNRWRIPTLDEIKDIFTEGAEENYAPEEEAGVGADEGENGGAEESPGDESEETDASGDSDGEGGEDEA